MEDNTLNEMEGDVPVITVIHRSEKSFFNAKTISFIIAFALLLIASIAFLLYRHYDIGISVSVSTSQNITKLKQTTTGGVSGVVCHSDTILDVPMTIFSLEHLSASLSFAEPDTADTDVMFYCRSADHKSDLSYLGSLVVDGKEYCSDTNRRGYCAMANGNIVIGISRSEKVKDYVEDCGGSFFRQFILVSDGVLPSRFLLHGKVERCALGRMPDDKLYFVQSLNKETMWDFADALREYGFIDAIYITGGRDYSFYRDADGLRHDINNPADYPHEKWKGVIPWLVFKRR